MQLYTNHTHILVPYNSIKASAVRNSITRFPSNRRTSQTRKTVGKVVTHKKISMYDHQKVEKSILFTHTT